MKSIKQTKLLGSVLTSDILYFTGNNTRNKNSIFYSNKIALNNKAYYTLLNVIVFLQSIKQLIRLLQYNLKHYSNFIQLITSSNLYNQIIEYISKSYGTAEDKITARSNLNNKLNSKLALYIDNDTAHNLSHLVYKTFTNNINSIVLINSQFNKNGLGNYKIFTNINNYKKLLFIIMIILLSQKNVDKKLVNTLNSKNK